MKPFKKNKKNNVIHFQNTTDHIPILRLQLCWMLHKHDHEDSCCQLRSLHQNWIVILTYIVWPLAKTQLASLMATCSPHHHLHLSEVAEPFLSVLWIGIAHLSSTSWTMWGSEELNAEIGACVCVRERVGGMRHQGKKGRYYATIQLEAFFFSSARRLHLSRPPFMSPLATCSRNSWTFSETFQRPASFSLPPSLSLAPSTLFHNWKETKETLLL